MKRLLLTLITLASLFGISAQRQYRITSGDFSSLKVECSVNVDYYCNPDSVGIVVIDANEESINWLTINNNGKGKLSIRTTADFPGKRPLPSVRVYSSCLEQVSYSGDSLVKTHDIVAVERFKASLSGNGRISVHGIEATKVNASIDTGSGQIVLTGHCSEASLRNIGTGTIQADGLEAETVKATIIGTGDIGCDPRERLTVMGAGSGNVFYRSTPSVIKNRAIGVHTQQM